VESDTAAHFEIGGQRLQKFFAEPAARPLWSAAKGVARLEAVTVIGHLQASLSFVDHRRRGRTGRPGRGFLLQRFSLSHFSFSFLFLSFPISIICCLNN
jgi:hypothetical protein